MSKRLRSQVHESEESEGTETDESEGNFDSEEDANEEEEEVQLQDEEEDEYLKASDEDDQNSDDDAPEDVRFMVSKDLALKNMKDAMNLLKNEKNYTKNKRKQKDMLFQQQKKQKLANLEKSKLSDDILQAVSGKSIIKSRRSVEEEGEEKQSKNSRIRFENECEVKDDLLSKSVEFIPLNSSKGLVVKSVKSVKKQTSDTAKEFKNNMLYGGRIKRIDAQSLERQKAKRRARYV